MAKAKAVSKQELVEIVRSLEWAKPGGYCAKCAHHRSEGHAEACPIQRALK